MPKDGTHPRESPDTAPAVLGVFPSTVVDYSGNPTCQLMCGPILPHPYLAQWAYSYGCVRRLLWAYLLRVHERSSSASFPCRERFSCFSSKVGMRICRKAMAIIMVLAHYVCAL